MYGPADAVREHLLVDEHRLSRLRIYANRWLPGGSPDETRHVNTPTLSGLVCERLSASIQHKLKANHKENEKLSKFHTDRRVAANDLSFRIFRTRADF